MKKNYTNPLITVVQMIPSSGVLFAASNPNEKFKQGAPARALGKVLYV